MKTSETKELNRLLNVWHSWDIEARDINRMEVAIGRARMILKKNPHWSRLGDTLADIQKAFEILKAGV